MEAEDYLKILHLHYTMNNNGIIACDHSSSRLFVIYVTHNSSFLRPGENDSAAAEVAEIARICREADADLFYYSYSKESAAQHLHKLISS